MHGRASENESNWHVVSGTKKTNSTVNSYFYILEILKDDLTIWEEEWLKPSRTDGG